MQTLIRVAIAAAAVVAISVAWLNFGPSRGGVGGPAAPSPTPVPSPTPTPQSLAIGSTGSPLTSGSRYLTGDPFPIRLSFQAPSGWSGHIGGPYAVWLGPVQGDDVVSFQLSPTLYADPCHQAQEAVTPTFGPAASDLVDAIVTRPGLAPATPSQTTLGGLPATTFTLMLKTPPSACTTSSYVLWKLPLGATNELQAGMSERVWVLDVSGQRLVVEADNLAGASQAQQQAIQQVLDSIRFEPAG